MKPFIRFIVLFTAPLLVTTTGCFDLEFMAFTNPLVAPADAELQDELLGSFVVTEPPEPKMKDAGVFAFAKDQNEPRSSILHLGKAGKGFPKGFIRWIDVSHASSGEINVKDSDPCFATKIGNYYLLNIPVGENDEGDDETKKVTQWNPEDYDGYLMVILKPTKTGFTVHWLDEDFFKSEITAKRLAGKFMTEKQKEEYKKNPENKWTPFTVEATTKELQVFFKKNAEKLADSEALMILKRIE